MIDRLKLEYDEGVYTLIIEDDGQIVNGSRRDRRSAQPIEAVFGIPESVLLAFLDSPMVAAALEHRTVGESIRVERAATGGLPYAEAHVVLDPHELARERADQLRDLARGK